MFHLSNPKDIKEGRITDVYFNRTVEIIKKNEIDRLGGAEVRVRNFPDEGEWAILAGIDEVAYLLKEEPVGTIPHSLILLIGDTVEATCLFHEVIEPMVKRVALIDTFGDEKFESIRVAEKLRKNLFAVRLDTTSSLLKLSIDKGELIEPLPSPKEIRKYVLNQLEEVISNV